MKILKYIFLLLLLSFISLSIYIATQKGDFTVERTIVIQASKIDIYNYVNDYRNWGNIISFLAEDEKKEINLSKNNPEKINSSCTWKGIKGEGFVQTLALNKPDSIFQKMNHDGTDYLITWKFKDTIGGTKVSWKSTGIMSFPFKIYTFLNGGADRIIGTDLEKSLANLDTNLDYEINTFSIKENGIVRKLETNYLYQTFSSTINNVLKNRQIVFSKIITFCKQNHIEFNGKPFVIYHTKNINGLSKISFCVPIKQAINTSDGSDIMASKLNSFLAVKTTLIGDNSHIEKALEKSKSYFNTNKITPSSKFSHIEIYTISGAEIKNPSKWKTEIYFPIKPKYIAPKIVPKVEKVPLVEPQPEQETPEI
jgi:effector-binding domain-containing protein